MSHTRSEITTINTFEAWIEGLKSQIEAWRDNFDEDEDVYFLLGEFHKDKFPKYSTKTPKEGAGSICKAGYAADALQEDTVLEAFKQSDKSLFGILTLKSENISNPDHEQVYTPEELIEEAERIFEVYRNSPDNYVVMGGVAYDGYEVSGAESNDYKRFNKLKFDPEIFKSEKDCVGALGRESRLDWYGTIIVNEKYLSEKWQKKQAEKREEEEE